LRLGVVNNDLSVWRVNSDVRRMVSRPSNQAMPLSPMLAVMATSFASDARLEI